MFRAAQLRKVCYRQTIVTSASPSFSPQFLKRSTKTGKRRKNANGKKNRGGDERNEKRKGARESVSYGLIILANVNSPILLWWESKSGSLNVKKLIIGAPEAVRVPTRQTQARMRSRSNLKSYFILQGQLPTWLITILSKDLYFRKYLIFPQQSGHKYLLKYKWNYFLKYLLVNFVLYKQLGLTFDFKTYWIL